MKKTFLAVAMAALMSSSAMAGTKIGVSMALFDDNFLTVLRNGMIEQAKGIVHELRKGVRAGRNIGLPMTSGVIAQYAIARVEQGRNLCVPHAQIGGERV